MYHNGTGVWWGHNEKNTELPKKPSAYFGERYLEGAERYGAGYIAIISYISGLLVLHKMQVFHRDLKGANVFIGSDGFYKLGDMNVSTISKMGFAKTQTGTPYYCW